MQSLGAANQLRNVREYTIGEEVANSITHGIGALLAIAAIPITVVKAVSDGGGVLLFCALMYTIIMLLEYTASTLYHALTPDAAKRVFKVLDHSFIYLFIAASYTPYCLVTLADVGGWPLFFVVWGIAVAGVAAETFWVFRPRWVNAVLYLLLGWAVVGFIPTLYALLPPVGFWLLVVGGACYTIACIFYVLKQVPYFHAVFHVLIVAGSVFQYFSILLFVL